MLSHAGMIVYLFILAGIAVALMIFMSMTDAHLLPWSCPSCYHGIDENIAGESRHWSTNAGPGRVRCRWCGTYFKEHPDGSLVEDR